MTALIREWRLPITAVIGLLASGCAVRPTNPAFPVDVESARSRIREMQARPTELARPIVILNGWFEPGITTSHLKGVFRPAFEPDRIISVSFFLDQSYDKCRRKVVAAVDKAFPSTDPVWTTEVDVVAVSMGGLVARYAAMEMPGCRRLRIARLFTISTPHRGARSAKLPTLDPLVQGMRRGSDFLRMLDKALEHAGYEIIPYVRLEDSIVGAKNAAPSPQHPWWVPNRPLELAHIQCGGDPRIVADIMLRLRGDTPFSQEPRAPIPATDPPPADR
ncbi:MAG: hypothetical protein AB1696_12625 [Planctomycetota bacterium]